MKIKQEPNAATSTSSEETFKGTDEEPTCLPSTNGCLKKKSLRL